MPRRKNQPEKQTNGYYVRKLKLGQNDQLDELAKITGELYSKTVISFWRVVRKKGIWLSPVAMEKWMNSILLHAHSADAAVQSFFSAMKGTREARNLGFNAKFPYKQKQYFKINWKASAIRIQDGVLILSNGKISPKLYIPWKHELPTTVEIGWEGKEYELRATYEHQFPGIALGDGVAAIDLGEIHLLTTYDGKECITYNGRLHRSKNRERNKEYGKFQTMIAKTEKGSKQNRRLKQTERVQMDKLNNQKDDIETKHVSTAMHHLHQRGVSQVVVGDLRTVRLDNNKGKFLNQKIHQMPSGRVLKLVKHYAKKLGMVVILINEAYTSQDCPSCRGRNKPKGRNYVCVHCNWTGHRDFVGAYNIYRKYLEGLDLPVVGVMASPIGRRYKPHALCSPKLALQLAA